jgi:hypothetical protein
MAQANVTLNTPRMNVRIPNTIPIVLSVDRFLRAIRCGVEVVAEVGQSEINHCTGK